jgi:DNA polymerase elongation subunit (family B)
VIKAIEQETHLPLEFEGLYPWMAFLGRRSQPGIPVANRFFGLQPNGEHKIRGIALRREDTPPFVAAAQMGLLELLAQEKDPEQLVRLLPGALGLLRQALGALENNAVPLEQLVITQTLSRELDQYRVPSPLARAAYQLQQADKPPQMGQRVRYIHARSGAGVLAWDLADLGQHTAVDTARYKTLLFRAAYEVLQPLGIMEAVLKDWLFGGAAYLQPPGAVHQGHSLSLPLFASAERATFCLP